MDEARRRQLEALASGAVQAQSGSPGQLPPNIAQMIGMLPPQDQGKAQVRAVNTQIGQQIRQDNPVSTESERKATRVAQAALVPLQEIRQLIGAQGGQVANKAPISITRPSGHSDVLMSTSQKALRDKLNRTWDLLAMLRTGVAGEAKQKESLKAQSNIGEFDSPQTINERIEAMEREIQAFATGKLKSPLDEKKDSAPSEPVDFSQYTDEELRIIAGE